MLIYILITIIIIYIICVFIKIRNNNNKIYCNKYDICKTINKTEFKKIKELLIAYYNNLLLCLPENDERTTRLKKNFNKNTIFEVYPDNLNNDTSFSINKGEELGICIRHNDTLYNIHDLDIILYVFTHELGHLITLTEQHTPEFWRNFKWLLSYCYKNNLIKIKNYENNNEKYCGMVVDYNVYFDNEV